MFYDLLKFIVGIGADNVGSVDRAIFWAFIAGSATSALAIIALRQLRGINETAKAEFTHKFKNDFFKPLARELIMLFDYAALNFKVKNLNKNKEDEIAKDFPYFEINKDLLKTLKISSKDQKCFDEGRDVYTAYEVDDNLLGHFEDIAYYEKGGLLDINMVYESFDWYIEMLWENEQVQKYIEWQNEDDEQGDIYDGFKYIYKKCKSYGKAKNNGQWLLLSKIRWWLCKGIN